MILIVGLGNPGTKYEKTRHNLGYQVVDRLADNFRFDKKFNAQITKKGDLILAKPMTFMNASGYAVSKILQYYNIPIDNLWIVHDDVDLPLGKIKIRRGGAAAGHHGVESIIRQLADDQFVRFRLGIGHPDAKSVEKFVLSEFSQKEATVAKKMIKKTVKAIGLALKKGIEKAMNQFN